MLENILKPILLITLMFWYWKETKASVVKLNWTFLFALFFSLLGDVFLMPLFDHFIFSIFIYECISHYAD